MQRNAAAGRGDGERGGLYRPVFFCGRDRGGLLYDLHRHARGRRLLAAMALGRFAAASDVTYQPVHEFPATFENPVRPIGEGP